VTRVCIAGAGIAGTFLAIALARRGISVCLLERRMPDPATGQLPDGGRSIALALSHRGLHALGLLGLEERATKLGRPLQGRRIHPRGEPTLFTVYDPTGRGRLFAISRAELYGLLHEAVAAEPGVERRFGAALAGWSQEESGGVRVRLSCGGPAA
jgi:kynurenine 3-monooxygenase